MAKTNFYTDGLPNEAKQLLEAIGQNFAVARKRRRWRMSDAAERVECTRQTVAHMENGDPSVAMGAWLKYAFAMDLLDGFSEICNPDKDKKGQLLDKESRANLKRVREKREQEPDFTMSP